MISPKLVRMEISEVLALQGARSDHKVKWADIDRVGETRKLSRMVAMVRVQECDDFRSRAQVSEA